MKRNVKRTSKRSSTSAKLPKKRSVNELKRELWKVFSAWVRRRDRMTCYTCGKTATTLSGCHAGHYVPQSRGSALRFDPRNVHCQCVTCNTFRRGNLYSYALRLEAEYGHGILQEFQEIAAKPMKWERGYLEGKIAEYKQKLQEMEAK